MEKSMTELVRPLLRRDHQLKVRRRCDDEKQANRA